MKENDRNDHIYIQLMKQHNMTQYVHLPGYSLKTVFHKSTLQIFAFWLRKVLEGKTIQQNVRNGHNYIQLMKQHMT